MNNIPDDSSNDSLLEEVDLFLSNSSIPPGIENVADDPEGDIRFLEELLIDDSILSHESSDSNFEENLSIPRPPLEPPDVETDAGKEIPVMMNDKDEDVDYSYSMFVIFDKVFSLLSAESEDTIFDPDAYSFNNNSNYLPQPQHENYLCNLCGNNSHDGYDCQQQFSYVYGQEPSYNQNYYDNYYPYDLLSFPCYDNCEGSHETFRCQPMDQNIDFPGSDRIQTPQYPEIHPPSQKISDEIFQANHSVQYKENLENSSNSNQEKEEPSQNSDIRQLIREECCVEASEEQKQNMEDTMLELVKICQKKELLCIHDNVDDLIESALKSKLLLINSNSQLATILSTKEPEYSSSMGYENLNTTLEMETDEIIKSGVEELVPILSENEVTLEDKRECDMFVCENSPICDDHSDILYDSKIDDDISVYNDDFEDIEYVEASLSDPEIINGVEEENIVHQAEDVFQQEEEEVDLENISQIQDVVLREKLLSITRLISNIESLNDNPTPDCVLSSFESDNSLSDNFSPEFETFCDNTKETRSGNTTHANDSLPEYDSFCFQIEPDQERLINLMKSNISDDSSSVPLLEEADLFVASDNSIPPSIENFANDSKGDIRFLEEFLIDDSILSHESSDSNFEDNPSIPRPPPKPPNDEYDAGEEIPVVMNDKDEDVDYSFFIFVIFAKVFSFLSAESEDTIFDPGFTPSD
nr:hypothetical protein [Tanacetum cinerariifolium]